MVLSYIDLLLFGMNRLRPKSPFLRLVAGLKEQGKTLSVVETCCGGLIQASVMAVPGSSAGIVYRLKLRAAALPPSN